MWSVYAVGAAFFAALTAIFAKLGVGNVDSNLAAGITGFTPVPARSNVLCTGTTGGWPGGFVFSAVSGLGGEAFRLHCCESLMSGVSRRRPVSLKVFCEWPDDYNGLLDASAQGSAHRMARARTGLKRAVATKMTSPRQGAAARAKKAEP